MLAGMLALFQGREAPVPRRYMAKVRLIASCVLITSAFLLFSDKDTSFSPRKLNALMVFGFVLNYYFGPKSFGLGTTDDDDCVLESPRAAAEAKVAPVGAAYFSMPKDYDMRRGNLSRGTDRLPEGWGMQVDGGDFYKGTRKMYRGRSKIPKRQHEMKKRYVAEELGEWSSAEDSFNRMQHKKGAVRDKYDFHVPQQLTHKNKYAEVLPSQAANNLKTKKPAKKPPGGGPVINYSKDKVVEEDKDKDKKGRKSLAVVTDLTNLGSNNVFKINPMEEQQMKMATTVMENEKRAFKHPTCFQINPLKIAGVNDDDQDAAQGGDESTDRTRTVPAGSTSVLSRKVSLPRSASVYPVISDRNDERRRQLQNLTSKTPTRVPQDSRVTSGGISARGYHRPQPPPPPPPPPPRAEDTPQYDVGKTYPEGHDAYWDQERIRDYINRSRRERKRRRNFPAKIPEMELRKKREAKRRAQKRERLEREIENQRRLEREANDPWAYAFDGTVARDFQSPLYTFSVGALSRLMSEYKTLLFLALVALSHLGYFMMTTNKTKLAALLGNWSQQMAGGGNPAVVTGQTLLTIPSSSSSSPLDCVMSAGAAQAAAPQQDTIVNNPVFIGYMEAFLLFCLVKGSVDCVDKMFPSM